MPVFGAHSGDGAFDGSQRCEKIVRQRVEKDAAQSFISSRYFQSPKSDLLAGMLDCDCDQIRDCLHSRFRQGRADCPQTSKDSPAERDRDNNCLDARGSRCFSGDKPCCFPNGN
jgi:hypothetical protein